jgi:Fic family protein
MGCGDKYLWELADWPQWRYDLAALAQPLADVSRAQGRLIGRLVDIGLELRDETQLAALSEDVLKTSEIEGEVLDPAAVRSSIARRLGVESAAVAPVDRQVEGVVDMVLDATSRCHDPLTAERLYGWHAALFPTGRSGMFRIKVGGWRDDADGPMQVVSGPIHRRKVHYEAPPAQRLESEMSRFLEWAEAAPAGPALLKAGLAHLWFVTIHPFDDGNGRIGRAIGDLFIARAEQSPQRFYSLSAQIRRERHTYYDILQTTQIGTMDVTAWLGWFLGTLHRAIDHAHSGLDIVLAKSRFWQRWAGTPLNARQAKVINRLLDGFEGRMTSSRWASMTRCSPDTALRDITELLDRGILQKLPGGGRRTGYALMAPDPQ